MFLGYVYSGTKCDRIEDIMVKGSEWQSCTLLKVGGSRLLFTPTVGNAHDCVLKSGLRSTEIEWLAAPGIGFQRSYCFGIR